MYNILFVCYGNICRSPMAEMIFKDMVYKSNKRYMISCVSRATSVEELGNDIHPGTQKKLLENNIPYTRHYASKVEETDYNDFDYFICMDDKNVRNLSYIFDDPKNKVYKLLSKDIADPWYTGNFDLTYDEIVQGINYLISDLKSK